MLMDGRVSVANMCCQFSGGLVGTQFNDGLQHLVIVELRPTSVIFALQAFITVFETPMADSVKADAH